MQKKFIMARVIAAGLCCFLASASASEKQGAEVHQNRSQFNIDKSEAFVIYISTQAQTIRKLRHEELVENEELREWLLDASGLALAWRQEFLKTVDGKLNEAVTNAPAKTCRDFILKYDHDNLVLKKYGIDVKK